MSCTYHIERLSHSRGRGEARFELSVPSLRVARGARIALVGPSGCGKSTLLDILALILLPGGVERFQVGDGAGGSIDVTPLLGRRDHSALAGLRNRNTGYVLQTGGLLPFLTVAANIALPCDLLGRPDGGRVERIATRLRIDCHLAKKPGALSVGERQRVAIARALVHEPQVVLADEPTAALDPESADLVMRLLVDLAEESGTTVIMASHDWDRVDRFGLIRVQPVLQRADGGSGVQATFAH